MLEYSEHQRCYEAILHEIHEVAGRRASAKQLLRRQLAASFGYPTLLPQRVERLGAVA